MKFTPSYFLGKPKILKQNFFSSLCYFAIHNKNLAKKLSDFDEILTSKSTQMVFWVVKFLPKSDNFLAKFLNFLKGPPIKNFLNRFFSTGMNSQTIFHIDSGWLLTFGLGPLSGELWIHIEFHKDSSWNCLFRFGAL